MNDAAQVGRVHRPRQLLYQPGGDLRRLGLADGEAHLLDLETQLAAAPAITVPAITMEGDANGAPHPEPGTYAGKFSGPYAHRTIEGGIGHNLPQERPAEWVKAVLDVRAATAR